MPPKPTQSKLNIEEETVTNENVQGSQIQVEEIQSHFTSIQAMISGIPVMQEVMAKITTMMETLLKDSKKITETPTPVPLNQHQYHTISPTSFTLTSLVLFAFNGIKEPGVEVRKLLHLHLIWRYINSSSSVGDGEFDSTKIPPKPTQSKLNTEEETMTKENVQGLQTQVEEIQSHFTSIQATISGIPVMQEAMAKIATMMETLLKDSKKITETPTPVPPNPHQYHTISPTSFTPTSLVLFAFNGIKEPGIKCLVDTNGWCTTNNSQRGLLLSALELRFGPSSYDNHRSTLFKLRQTCSVEEFQTQFETLCNRVNGLPPDAILDCFFVRIKARNPERVITMKTHHHFSRNWTS
ncbi:hypothetical protein POM88_038721 [Heracleum sosnowskyi]|uniref:Retrotransposon gag domain-containing protein n=1 Tax=Heracleum sosnowskyi TaxID=360622 RepID=A0AAD8HBS3_9APIA|nr:hypothetical protein POM88_038721 [Heracleum sosnowskyi]